MTATSAESATPAPTRKMGPTLRLERIVSRVAGVPLTALSDRTLGPDQKARVRAAVAALIPAAGRLAFAGPPFSLEHVAAAGTDFQDPPRATGLCARHVSEAGEDGLSVQPFALRGSEPAPRSSICSSTGCR